MSSAVPCLPDDDVQFVSGPTASTAPAAAGGATTTTVLVDGNLPAHAATTNAAVAAHRKYPFPTQTKIRDNKYQALRFVLAGEIVHLKLHTIFHQNNRSKAWNEFYNACLREGGIMGEFMLTTSATAGKTFREVLYSGIEWDAQNYSAWGACDEEPSELEILSSIIITERDEAKAAYDSAKAAKTNKVIKERAENEAAEVQLGLRGGPGLIAPSPTTTLLGANHTSLLGGNSSRSRQSHEGEIDFHTVIFPFSYEF
jgi:hypothetical protein